MKWTPSLLFSLMSLPIVGTQAGVMRSDVPLQDYRDFAENKGRFRPGVTGIQVYRTDGTLAGILSFPMPDFSAVEESLGLATLVHPQYIMSVAHNREDTYMSARFGRVNDGPDARRFRYAIVRRNNQTLGTDANGKLLTRDFHTPRLHKLVVETAPVPYIDGNREYVRDTNVDPARWSAIVRVGAGYQKTMQPDGRLTNVGGAYEFLTGGTGGISGARYEFDKVTLDNRGSNMFADESPLNIYTQSGDSGSPLFFLNDVTKEWALAGVLGGTFTFGNGKQKSNWNMPDAAFFEANQRDDLAPEVLPVAGDGMLTWSTQGISQGAARWSFFGLDLTKTSADPALTGKDKAEADYNAALDAGKNQTFGGDGGTVELTENIHQGAGALTFTADYTIQPRQQETWQGGGIIVKAGRTVDWRVNGVKDDNLHKIGPGTLLVNGTGINPGGLRVGDGTVRLAQRVDISGNQQAFSVIDIVSGRPTVVLDGDNQMPTDQLYFGYRGGRLDMNGRSLTFSRIRHVDDGARIVNHNAVQAANVTISGSGRQLFEGWLGETDPSRTNGALRVEYSPGTADAVLALTGGARLTDTFRVNQGTLLLSGSPVSHAGGVVIDDDWNTGDFEISTIDLASDSVLQMGRDVRVKANVNAAPGSRLSIGETDGATDARDNTWRCLTTSTGPACQQGNTPAAVSPAPPSTVWEGDLTMEEDSAMGLRGASFRGRVRAERNSRMTIAAGGDWQLTGDSTVGSLRMRPGSTVRLNDADAGVPARFNTLTVSNTLEGEGDIIMHTNMVAGQGDKLNVQGPARGKFTLSVFNHGLLPDGSKRLPLAYFVGDRSGLQLDLALAQGFADIGNYRYQLKQDEDTFVLYNERGENGQQGEYSQQGNDAVSRYAGRVNLFNHGAASADRWLSRLSPDRTGLYLEQDITQMTYRTAEYRPFRQTFSSQTLGYDGALPGTREKGLYGMRVTRAGARLKQDGGGRSQLQQVDAAAYGRWRLDNGLELGGRASLGLEEAGKPSAGGLSGTASWRWQRPDGSEIRPTLGLAVSHLSGRIYTDERQNAVQEKAVTQWQWSAGVDIKAATIAIKGVSVQPWGYAGVSTSYISGQGVAVGGQSLEATLSERGAEARVGADIRLTPALYLGAEVGLRRGDTIRQQRQAAFNLRYRW